MAAWERSGGSGKPSLEEEMRHHFVEVVTPCPYGLPYKAVYLQASFVNLPEDLLGRFFASGFRRNGNCMYTMRCQGCQRCVPIRLDTRQFQPDRNQRRTWKRNLDLTAGVAPLRMSRENLALLDIFLQTRFPDGKGSALDYYSGFFVTSTARCMEIRYRLGDRLVGVAVIDCASDWLNAVYFYFDPEFAGRSPGTLNILHLVNFCRSHDMKHLYLGYWLAGIQGMQYKARFQPHQLFYDRQWRDYSR